MRRSPPPPRSTRSRSFGSVETWCYLLAFGKWAPWRLMAYSLHRQRHPEADVGNCKQDASERIRQTNNEPSQLRFDVCECHASSPLLAHLPGLAKRPERNPEQGQVLDEGLPRECREGGEAAETRLPDARRRDQEAQGREEHPDRQGAPEGGSPRRERAGGDEERDSDLDDAQYGRDPPDAQGPVDPARQRAVGDERTDP